MGTEDLIVPVQQEDVEVFHMVKSRPEKGTGTEDFLGSLDFDPVFRRNGGMVRDLDLCNSSIKNIHEFGPCLGDL
jgi:hypothetical protein